jgi:S-adenosyl-L-methionine hydrolase (adenosine-forming)
MRPVIALLSDFGTRDHYAGTMKGVMLTICPDATLVDITHDVPPHDVMDGALQLAASARYFPAGTIFLAVVDPGVGSARRGIAAEAGDYRFVAPDNGVLTVVLREWAPKKIVELTERRYARPTVSRTFEGRDRFAPAAGWLAKGIQLTALGRPAPDYHRLDIPLPEVNETTITGVVLRVDRFGNLVTNIDRRAFEAAARAATVQVTAGGHSVGRLVATYADIQPGEICALFGSTDHLELAANSESAAERLQLARGAVVEVKRTA